ncbi:macro domain-containing protein [Thalassobacillus sp. CUG 92003]|uniref:macro domain-containing protein n=1 Tax=Thalassobacillus sp. CUG 92003 TaxID=2736641 RepID=UPI0015E67593|nr:macro domain-containing protein [Thalassobacillus sp. CUG 92003]
MIIEVDGGQIETRKGDIAAQQDMEAVVNAANAELLPGGGVAGALHSGAGPALADACAPFAPIAPGEAVLTEAFDLPNNYVIHCLGPVYGQDKPEAELLASCYEKALQIADDHSISNVAFPSLSTGAFGYPLEEAVGTAVPEVLETLSNCPNVNQVCFVLFSEKDLKVYEDYLTRIAG